MGSRSGTPVEVALGLHGSGNSLLKCEITDETSRRMRQNLHFMKLGNNDKFREGPVLSLATTVTMSGARESGARANAFGHYMESGDKSTAPLHCLLLPIPEKSTSGVTVVARSGQELPAAEVGKIVSLLSSTEMSIDQIAQRMGCCRST